MNAGRQILGFAANDSGYNNPQALHGRYMELKNKALFYESIMKV